MTCAAVTFSCSGRGSSARRSCSTARRAAQGILPRTGVLVISATLALLASSARGTGCITIVSMTSYVLFESFSLPTHPALEAGGGRSRDWGGVERTTRHSFAAGLHPGALRPTHASWERVPSTPTQSRLRPLPVSPLRIDRQNSRACPL